MRTNMIDTKSLCNETNKSIKQICEEMGFNYYSFNNMNSMNRLSAEKVLEKLEEYYMIEFVYDDRIDKLRAYSSLELGTPDCTDEIEIGKYVRLKEYGEIRKIVSKTQVNGLEWFVADKPFRYKKDSKITDLIFVGMIKQCKDTLFELVNVGDTVNGYVVTEIKDDCVLSENLTLSKDAITAIITAEKMVQEIYEQD